MEVHLATGLVGDRSRLDRGHVQQARVDLAIQCRAESQVAERRGCYQGRRHGESEADGELQSERTSHCRGSLLRT